MAEGRAGVGVGAREEAKRRKWQWWRLENRWCTVLAMCDVGTMEKIADACRGGVLFVVPSEQPETDADARRHGPAFAPLQLQGRLTGMNDAG